MFYVAMNNLWFQDNYTQECYDIQNLTDKARDQLYELQSFDISQNISYDMDVENIHLIKVNIFYALNVLNVF